MLVVKGDKDEEDKDDKSRLSSRVLPIGGSISKRSAPSNKELISKP